MDIITTHVNADFDCLGGMIAAKKLYPDAEMVFAGGQERSLREFFLKSAIYAYDFKRIKEIDLNGVKRLVLVDVHHSGRATEHSYRPALKTLLEEDWPIR